MMRFVANRESMNLATDVTGNVHLVIIISMGSFATWHKTFYFIFKKNAPNDE